ncbi:cytochrome d ubiquinol oxidase subunit II [Desulfurobacterium atlanticum]|uniref:Cytochrome bd-I ubiquinol oxidase subunit 2 apoprotein n=1 Tax=Desulfurobacterium atlanticum TaxID=240169 RepID=A0A238ZM42_9BACT|nr:cytochrome d ubiquinol oxidase subunit II [Desulfurobacterium atlanticum]SNR83743.1 cytochrome bd-I ubiquinol oxidase subunit 2 apoprotein [Desulfurobacterium atlanticum]
MSFDLQSIWFLLVGVLIIAYLITDGFDFGVGILHPFIAKTDLERRAMLNSIGPVWDGNEVWLITAGAAVFAAFPEMYAALFSSLYIALFVVLVALIMRACAFEFRSKEESPSWRNFWDWMVFFGSAVPALLVGVAIGNVLAGLPVINSLAKGDSLSGFIYAEKFPISFINLVNPFTKHGLYGLIVGVTTFLFFTLHGVSWLLWKTEGTIAERAQAVAKKLWFGFVLFYVICLGFAYTISFKISNPEDLKYLGLPKSIVGSIVPFIKDGVVEKALFRYMPFEIVMILAAVVCAVLYYLAINKADGKQAFLFSALTVTFATLGAAIGAYPFLLPSSLGVENSITIYNAASSTLTLTVMLIAALIFVPIVVAYQVWMYRIFLFKVSAESIAHELQEEGEEAELY